jgi:4-amino-4-deoxy-L-arabinose transferase-like glycosyltransferase
VTAPEQSVSRRSPVTPSSVERRRRLVVVVALAAAACKLLIAANTLGTNDVFNFYEFAKGVREFGPIGMYGHHMVEGRHAFPVYNHPPLIGWMLATINWLTDHTDLSFQFLIRVPASLADIVTTVLVFELVRIRKSLDEATAAAVFVACSPALIIVSGFHGNTDPVFIMFTFLSFYLLFTNRPAFLAGLAFAAAMSVKIVPIVALPVLLLVAVRSGRRRVVQFLVGSAVVFVILWVPVLMHRWTPFTHEVLGFKGYSGRWGIVEIAKLAGFSTSAVRTLQDSGRTLLLLASAGIPLFVAWRRKEETIPAFGLSFVLVLLLSTGTAGRYLVWAVAAAFLINFWAAAVYDLASGLFLLVVYSRWNGAPPWGWNSAGATPWTHFEVFMAAIAWCTLLAVAVLGIRGSEVASRRTRAH